jgi:hypothetical protein
MHRCPLARWNMTHGWIKRAKEAARPKTEQQQPKEVHRSSISMRAEYAEAARRSRSTKDRRRRERRDCSKKLGSDRASSLRQFVSLWCQLRPNEDGCDHDQHPDAGKHPTAVIEFRSGERDNADNNALPDRHPENRKARRISRGPGPVR